MAKQQNSRAAKARSAGKQRLRKLTRSQTKTKAKTEVRKRTDLPNSFRLSAQVAKLLLKFWKPLGGIILVYLVLNVLFASGVSSISSTVEGIKADFNNSTNDAHPFLSGSSGFLALIASAGAGGSSTASTLQTVLIIVESLVIIWALRQLLAGKKITVKQAYYNSLAPLVPFVLILFFIILQLLPITFGSAILSAIAASLGVISGFWSIVLALVFILLAAWSFFMISASIFALYIVTLPDMQPRDALRSAKNLVRFRRWPILRRVIFLPLLLLVISGVVIIPLILYATPLVAPVFYGLSMLVILFVHAYLYSLYRELLK